jgi:hypothetical protein
MKSLRSPLWVALLLSSTLFAQAGTNGWTLIGWNDLGMHCMDGSDYSLFSVLPPFNTFQAQLVYRGKLITNSTGIEVTYEAVADPDGSFNSTSKDKINFWQFAGVLYGASPAGDAGLAGYSMPGVLNIPQAMHFADGQWKAEGVPITPYDDGTNKNFYPMMRLVARSNGTILARTDIVLPVSDEMDCRTCHRSGAGDAAQPAVGWIWTCGQERDVKLNILRLHDDRHAGTTLYSNALEWAGYAPGLFASAVSNATPVLCAKCHKSNALGTTGFPGVHHFTHAMHGLHANVVDPLTGTTLDAAVNRASCYRCHPGSETKCLRGAMGASIAADGAMAVNCQQCHGNLAQVAVTNREGWFMEPNTPAAVLNVITSTLADVAVEVHLAASDVNGNALTLRIVQQPARGTVALSSNVATYFPDARMVGTDTFTYAAWDGSTDSNLATAKVAVAQGGCVLTLGTAAPLTAPVGTAVPFWSFTSAGFCSNAISITWSFGDSAGATLPNDCHSYAAPGEYAWQAVAVAGGAILTNHGLITITSGLDDADGDGLSDAWELQNFPALTNANGQTDGDLDGFIDLYEYLAGTSPTNNQSLLVVTAETTAQQNAGIVVQWARVPGKVYTLSRTLDLAGGQFQNIATQLPAMPVVNVYTDQSPAEAGAVYRVGVGY